MTLWVGFEPRSWWFVSRCYNNTDSSERPGRSLLLSLCLIPVIRLDSITHWLEIHTVHHVHRSGRKTNHHHHTVYIYKQTDRQTDKRCLSKYRHTTIKQHRDPTNSLTQFRSTYSKQTKNINTTSLTRWHSTHLDVTAGGNLYNIGDTVVSLSKAWVQIFFF